MSSLGKEAPVYLSGAVPLVRNSFGCLVISTW